MASGLPRIRGTQVGLKNPGNIDKIKEDMLTGRFTYQELQARIGGVRDHQGTYYIVDGHHRMVAAFELYQETGDLKFIQELLFWGKWDEVEYPHPQRRPLPSRYWWQAFRNWWGF